MSPAIKRKSSPDISTPTGSPQKKMRITRNQKQALMDNLQLEITERARKLRAQYALQTNDLRARIERRVNRIPVALRKEKMGDLFEKHSAENTQQHGKTASKKPVQSSKGRSATAVSVDPDAHPRRTRKQSHEGVYSDKENAPTASPVGGLKNPKRRANGAGAQKVRGEDSRILSPKSLNSKTYLHSPLRGSPDKLQNRTVSPLKPSSPLRAAPASAADNSRSRTAKAPASTKDNRPPSQLRGTRAGNTGPRAVRSPVPRAATRQNERRLSTSTTSSVASSGTTVVKSARPATATGARKPTTTCSAPKTTVARNQAPVAAKKGTTGAKATPGDTSGRRALRKRA